LSLFFFFFAFSESGIIQVCESLQPIWNNFSSSRLLRSEMRVCVCVCVCVCQGEGQGSWWVRADQATVNFSKSKGDVNEASWVLPCRNLTFHSFKTSTNLVGKCHPALHSTYISVRT
jgi:hypothetical protein